MPIDPTRIPRKAKPTAACDEAWFYAEEDGLYLFTRNAAGVAGVMLTPRQVERALEVMRAAAMKSAVRGEP